MTINTQQYPYIPKYGTYGIIIVVYASEDLAPACIIERSANGTTGWEEVGYLPSVKRIGDYFVDELPNDLTARFYRAKHIWDVGEDGPYTDVVSGIPIFLDPNLDLESRPWPADVPLKINVNFTSDGTGSVFFSGTSRARSVIYNTNIDTSTWPEPSGSGAQLYNFGLGSVDAQEGRAVVNTGDVLTDGQNLKIGVRFYDDEDGSGRLLGTVYDSETYVNTNDGGIDTGSLLENFALFRTAKFKQIGINSYSGSMEFDIGKDTKSVTIGYEYKSSSLSEDFNTITVITTGSSFYQTGSRVFVPIKQFGGIGANWQDLPEADLYDKLSLLYVSTTAFTDAGGSENGVTKGPWNPNEITGSSEYATYNDGGTDYSPAVLKIGTGLSISGGDTLEASGGSGIFNQTGSYYATTNDLQVTGSFKVTGEVTASAISGALDMADAKSGTLPVSRGGTGKATFTPYGVVYASDATTLADSGAPTDGGAVLISVDGTSWTPSAPPQTGKQYPQVDDGVFGWTDTVNSSSWAETASYVPGASLNLEFNDLTDVQTVPSEANQIVIWDGGQYTLSSTLVSELLNKIGTGVVSSSAFTSPSQGTVRATINGVQTDVDTGLQTGDSPTFANATISTSLTAPTIVGPIGTFLNDSGHIKNFKFNFRYDAGDVTFWNFQPNAIWNALERGYSGSWSSLAGVTNEDRIWYPDMTDHWATLDMSLTADPLTIELSGSMPVTSAVQSIRTFLQWHGSRGYATASFAVKRNDDVWVDVSENVSTSTGATAALIFSDVLNGAAAYPTYTPWRGIRVTLSDKLVSTGLRYIYGMGLYAPRDFFYPYMIYKKGDTMYGPLSFQNTGNDITTPSGYDLSINPSGNVTLTGSLFLNGDIDFGTFDGDLKMAKGGYIKFYEDDSAMHSISSRGLAFTEQDDLRINTYGSLFINLDSNNNNTDTADFVIGRHGGTGTISDILLTLNGESGILTGSGAFFEMAKISGSAGLQVQNAQIFTEGYYDNGTIASGGTLNVNWANGNSQKCAANLGNITIAVDQTSAKIGTSYTMKVRNISASSRTVSWSGVDKWVGGSAPTAAMGAGNQTTVQLYIDEDGLGARYIVGHAILDNDTVPS